ncbi:MAG TPA: hypothetical protein VGF16_06430 [Bryobacteraceae bacterium]|jgi:hypothetical protein
MRLKVDLNLDEAYTIADLDGDIATEVARSMAGLREILKLMGAPRDLIESVLQRIDSEKSIQITY